MKYHSTGESITHHCCFEASVFTLNEDLEKIMFCECYTLQDAEEICKALNEMEAKNNLIAEGKKKQS
jgi:hypothetical protein